MFKAGQWIRVKESTLLYAFQKLKGTYHQLSGVPHKGDVHRTYWFLTTKGLLGSQLSIWEDDIEPAPIEVNDTVKIVKEMRNYSDEPAAVLPFTIGSIGIVKKFYDTPTRPERGVLVNLDGKSWWYDFGALELVTKNNLTPQVATPNAPVAPVIKAKRIINRRSEA